jgi:ribose transport system substrate-binding protein
LPLRLTLYPDIELIGVDYNEDDPTLAASQLQVHPDLAGISGTNLFGAEGAATAVREVG